MKRRKQENALDADPVLRALRQHADEVLSEEIPERLLRILGSAERRSTGDQPAAPSGGEPEASSNASSDDPAGTRSPRRH